MASEESPVHAAAREDAEKATAAVAMEDLERSYVAMKEERDSLQLQLDTLRSEANQLKESQTEKQALELKASTFQLELTRAQQRVKGTLEEKTALEERLDRTLAEADKLREEIR